ncbi:MAG: insulinase family protein [candidate division KSB1 bacterium]|nr:insulinase family protein [candidate division KSB1 bacterium]MDZ7273771.1 insulinase family protein [candidate division KSB1 bacterium]MDZ7285927.1 insulinase family protein [candidate division KSB1 bacterium]MDZ7298959.1 insulinase family protein [candidate division KSB1 bacterium]MDZ7308602.1 insulinase family protein [candidate division KSB1 bacterium]
MREQIAAFAASVHEHRLGNGLQIILHEDHTLPQVAMHIFWRVGSRNESPGGTGLAHFIEHLMFNGGKNYGPGRFDEIMEAHGGANNAFTNQNLTVYQNSFPASALATIFDLEADRMAGLQLEKSTFAAERKVIASERRSTVENDNFELLNEKLWATAFTVHPYRWPVIGWPQDIQRWKLADLKEFHHRYYTPANAVMVLAGDLDPEETLRLCEHYFGGLPGRPAPTVALPVEPPQTAPRRADLHLPAHLPAFTCGFHTPASRHPDHFALQLLEIILVAGQSSRLYRRLVDGERLAAWVRSDYGPSLDPGLFILTVQCSEGRGAEAGEQVLREELQRLRDEPVSAAELRKAQNICRAAFVRSLTTLAGKADTLGSFAIYFDDYRLLFEALDHYAALTPDDLQAAANAWLQPAQSTLVTLHPEP